jgi:hypothetical protein
LAIWEVGSRRGFVGASGVTGKLNNKARVRTFIVFLKLLLPIDYGLRSWSQILV